METQGFFVAAGLPYGTILLSLGILFGFYMAWSIGANDLANAMGTSVGSGSLRLKQAVLIGAIMEFLGSVLVGSHVSQTVRSGIFDPTKFDAMTLVLAFLAALLAAAAWLQIATYFGWPVSTTHSIVGSLIGTGVLVGGFHSVQWQKISSIVLSWITSPLCGGTISFLLMRLIQQTIFNKKRPLERMYRFIPFLIFYVAFVLTLVAVWKGLKNLHLNLPLGQALLVATGVAILCSLGSLLWIKRLRALHERERKERGIELESDVPGGIPFIPKKYREQPNPKVVLRPPLAPGSEQPARRWEYRRQFEFEKIEEVFALLVVMSASFVAFAHGANDVANAIGPLAAIAAIVKGGVISLKTQVPLWCLMLGGSGIVLGLATWGYRVIETVGRKITHLTPSRGFAAEISAATTIVFASRMGLPISTTHTLVGAVLGIGLARGIEYLNLRMVRDIVISWLVTIPAGAGLAVLFYYILRIFFH